VRLASTIHHSRGGYLSPLELISKQLLLATQPAHPLAQRVCRNFDNPVMATVDLHVTCGRNRCSQTRDPRGLVATVAASSRSPRLARRLVLPSQSMAVSIPEILSLTRFLNRSSCGSTTSIAYACDPCHSLHNLSATMPRSRLREGTSRLSSDLSCAQYSLMILLCININIRPNL
jgi:hypothetical protein